MLIKVRVQINDTEPTLPDPHPASDLTSSRQPSLFSGSVPEGGSGTMELSDSASTSVITGVLGSDTSLSRMKLLRL